jgi:formylglycine-generating enzyme required for sulfatase activity
MAFTFKGVRQAFRWCEPGTFLMGSPKDEPERFGDELQHEVTLTKGFWMADTPVTQALWEVIMGENPSEFKGEDRPVERISWEDAQAFVAKMNGLKAELKLCLPTEAQWEYACRAESATPFCWGDQINSTLVNFDGIIPTIRAVQVNTGQRQSRSRNCHVMTGGCTRCTVMCGNGVRIGMEITRRSQSSIHKGRNRAPLKIQISSQHFVAHKKCFLTYQLYAASPFFARASFCLEL